MQKRAGDRSRAGGRLVLVSKKELLGPPAGYADPSRRGPPIRGEPAGEVGITSQGGIGTQAVRLRHRDLSTEVAATASALRKRARHEHPATRSRVIPASVSSADIDSFAWQPTVRCGLEFDSSTWSWRRTGRVPGVSSTAARPRNATRGWARGSSATWSRGHRWLGRRASRDRASPCRGAPRGPLRSGLRQPRRGRWGSARIYASGRRVRTVRGRGPRAPIPLVRLARRRVRVMIVARTAPGAAPLSRLTRANETRGAVMKVFVAGATGVLGRALVPQLVARATRWWG
jgi:hypothetical protein